MWCKQVWNLSYSPSPCRKLSTSFMERIPSSRRRCYQHHKPNVCPCPSLLSRSDSLCQFTNLTTPLTHVSLDIPGSKIPFLRNTHMVVLVSPSSYVKRREQYKSRCEVRPLLFSWENMTTHQISLLLQLPDFPDAPSTQLLQPLLSTYEKTQEIPTFQDFIDLVNTTILPTLSPSDTTSFTTRLTVLETFIAESPRNRYRHPTDFAKLIKKGVLIVADLTASGMQPDRNHWTVVAMPLSGVNAVCEVLLDLFVGGSRACRRVVVVDDVQGFGKGGRVQLAVKGLVGKVGWTGNPVRVLVGVKDVGEMWMGLRVWDGCCASDERVEVG
ncbi:hypothetical protein BCR33DRAFT_130484 [Rhizoclosmatium globosum]|uniref:Uncharacterized protein n=1 Tax=Rhizoclosmatium globosum TaxID=329046 RepID=A0A1Y2CHY8_9FUNG|nr:hypothetical protein BCR33DRAFT_130484 [Rhizoclosmatium globosum]|eukprot:ORY46527.1 hypothetical protein BCR33DRAFT_130484 [Rhizoclosmatium globosum]